MLVITRRPGEWVVITVGDVEIRMQLNEFIRGKIRLSFDAPRSVQIDREEVHERKLMEKRNG